MNPKKRRRSSVTTPLFLDDRERFVSARKSDATNAAATG
jgi:hypothetical protein